MTCNGHRPYEIPLGTRLPFIMAKKRKTRIETEHRVLFYRIYEPRVCQEIGAVKFSFAIPDGGGGIVNQNWLARVIIRVQGQIGTDRCGNHFLRLWFAQICLLRKLSHVQGLLVCG